MKVTFSLSALMDFVGLPKSQQKTVTRMIGRLLENPRSKEEGGYGIPLGNKGGNNLTGLLEGKLRGAGLRIIYELRDEVMEIIAVGERENEKIYAIAGERYKKL